MATPYAEYYNKALADYKPQMDVAMKSANATMADRGGYNSSAAVGALANIRNQYDSSARQAATQAQQFDVQAANQERQTALQWWDALQNYNLARQQMQPKWKGAQWAASPSWLPSFLDNPSLSSLIGAQTAATPAATSGYKMNPDGTWPAYTGVGDGKGELERGDQGYRVTDIGGGGDTQGFINSENARIANDKSLALQERRLAQEIEQYKFAKEQALLDRADKTDAAKAANDPWTAIATQAATNLSTPAGEGQMFPSALLSTWKAMYGVDVIAEAKAGNPKAVATLQTIYPETWEQILAGGYGGLDNTGTVAAASPAAAAVPTQGPRSLMAAAMGTFGPVGVGMGELYKRYPQQSAEAVGNTAGDAWNALKGWWTGK